jgi:hypothetical protein
MEEFDHTIDRSLKRLMDMQAARAKQTNSESFPLQPGWTKRRR